MAAPTVGNGYYNEIGVTTSANVTKPSGAAEGDDLYICVTTEDSTTVTVTPPAGFSHVLNSPFVNSADKLHIFKKTLGGSEGSTYTFTLDTGGCWVHVGAIIVQGGGTVEGTAMLSHSSGTDAFMPAYTTSGDERLLLGFGNTYDVGAFETVTGWSEPTGAGELVFYKSMPTAGTQSSVDSGFNSSRWVSAVLSIPAAASGPTGSGAPTMARHTAAGSGSTAGGGTSGSGSPTMARHTASGSGSTTGPVTGTSATTLARHTATGSGTTAAPGTASGSGSPTLNRHTAAGVGSTTVPGATGSGAPSLVRHAATGSGSTGVAGSGAGALARHIGAGSGTASAATVTGSSAVTLVRHVASGSGTTSVPASGSAAVTLVRLAAAGSGAAVDPGADSGDLVLVRHILSGSGAGTAPSPGAQIPSARLQGVQITGLSKDARRTEILRAEGLATIQTQADALPRGVVAYAEITANSTAFSLLTLISGLSVTFTAVAGRRYKFTFSGEVIQSVGTDVWVLNLEDTSVGLKRITSCNNTTASVSIEATYISNSSISGSKTWRINGSRASGSGNITVGAGSTYPAYILVEDIGPL